MALTGKDVLAALNIDEQGPQNVGSDAFERAVSNGLGAVTVELHRLARAARSTPKEVPVNEHDITAMIDDVRMTLEAHGIHELPGVVGEGARAGRDLVVGKLRSLLGETEKA